MWIRLKDIPAHESDQTNLVFSCLCRFIQFWEASGWVKFQEVFAAAASDVADFTTDGDWDARLLCFSKDYVMVARCFGRYRNVWFLCFYLFELVLEIWLHFFVVCCISTEVPFAARWSRYVMFARTLLCFRYLFLDLIPFACDMEPERTWFSYSTPSLILCRHLFLVLSLVVVSNLACVCPSDLYIYPEILVVQSRKTKFAGEKVQPWQYMHGLARQLDVSFDPWWFCHCKCSEHYNNVVRLWQSQNPAQTTWNSDAPTLFRQGRT